MERTQAKQNRQLALNENKETFHGEKCRYCSNEIRWTLRSHCCVCYSKAGMPQDLEKRKHNLLIKLKAQAKFKNIEFDITKDDIDWVEYCPIFKIKLDYFVNGFRQHNSVSFDRKDPNKGYIKNNVFIISNIANMRKSNLTIEQIESILEYVKAPVY